VVGLRNDRRRGIVNGQRGTVTGIDAERRCLDVELEGGKGITLDAGYLEAGHLDHGYAITAHRAQGATVDRAFVLGSDELYREWGYTALSRHREEARFYVTRADLGLDRDAVPEPDPVIRGIERLLSRSKAKDLAIDSLPDVDQRILESEDDVLREQFRDNPPPPPAPELERELRQAEADVAAARERCSLLERSRDGLRWHRRRDRTELTRLLDRNAVELEQRLERYEYAHHAHTTAVEAQQQWLEAHESDAGRLMAIDQELRQRDRLDDLTTRRLEEFHRAPSPLDRGLDAPVQRMRLEIGHDIGIDL
jgi:hypothetical protein